MRLSPLRYLLPALVVLTVVACSTNRDAFLNRTFHKLVTRDNGWFNANEKLKETVASMQKSHVDDYDEVLPIFVNGTKEEADAMTPELEMHREMRHRDRPQFHGDRGKEKNKSSTPGSSSVKATSTSNATWTPCAPSTTSAGATRGTTSRWRPRSGWRAPPLNWSSIQKPRARWTK
ncbi:MAG: hypothetical protein IPI05_05830 [Flavobacteriales bacterium]|nr:hypothetical protein [Flavobacteriales bacterium]